MQTITVAEAADKLSDLIDAALRGEEIVITKGDKSVVKLTPTTLVKHRQPGSAKGMVWMSDDFNEPLEDFENTQSTLSTSTKPRPKFGSAKGLIEMSDDFDEPLEDFKDYM